jgi:hypothetical protein
MQTNEEIIQGCKDAVIKIVLEHLGNVRDDLRETVTGCAREVAQDVAKYAVAAANDDPEAKRNLEHIKVQVYALAAVTLQHGTNEGAKTLTIVMYRIAQFAGLLLKSLLK